MYELWLRYNMPKAFRSQSWVKAELRPEPYMKLLYAGEGVKRPKAQRPRSVHDQKMMELCCELANRKAPQFSGVNGVQRPVCTRSCALVQYPEGIPVCNLGEAVWARQRPPEKPPNRVHTCCALSKGRAEHGAMRSPLIFMAYNVPHFAMFWPVTI